VLGLRSARFRDDYSCAGPIVSAIRAPRIPSGWPDPRSLRQRFGAPAQPTQWSCMEHRRPLLLRVSSSWRRLGQARGLQGDRASNSRDSYIVFKGRLQLQNGRRKDKFEKA
jgi:hypothetical protein